MLAPSDGGHEGLDKKGNEALNLLLGMFPRTVTGSRQELLCCAISCQAGHRDHLNLRRPVPNPPSLPTFPAPRPTSAPSARPGILLPPFGSHRYPSWLGCARYSGYHLLRGAWSSSPVQRLRETQE